MTIEERDDQWIDEIEKFWEDVRFENFHTPKEFIDAFVAWIKNNEEKGTV